MDELLRHEVRRVEEEVHALEHLLLLSADAGWPERTKQEDMGRDSVVENPYRRLLALESCDIAKDVELLRSKSVVCVGLSGATAALAECLTRVGIGRLKLCDAGHVEAGDVTGLFFRPELLGWRKAAAVKHVLARINPDVLIEEMHVDLSQDVDRQLFDAELAGVHLVVTAASSSDELLALNDICLSHRLPLVTIDADSGLGGSVRLISAGRTACMRCAGRTPSAIASSKAGGGASSSSSSSSSSRRPRRGGGAGAAISGTGIGSIAEEGSAEASDGWDDDGKREAEGGGGASTTATATTTSRFVAKPRLPSVEAVLAGALSQEIIRYMLALSPLERSIEYDERLTESLALTTTAPPNASCFSAVCRIRQEEVRLGSAKLPT